MVRPPIVLVACFLACGAAEAAVPTQETVNHGTYWRYLPPTVTPTSPVLALCHGSLADNQSAEETAHGFLRVWIELANRSGAALIAPVFSDRDFGAGRGCPHGWGYRGLYGRHVRADEFLHEIVEQLEKMNPRFDGKLHFFGHSAGGQFVAHYVVTHPDRVRSAVISAPAWLPFPTVDDTWPRGLAPRRSVGRWPGEDQDQVVEMVPKPEAFLAAAQLPLLATAGALDLEPLQHNASQGGDTHVARVESWAKAMRTYAKDQGTTAKVACVIVPNVGHRADDMARASMPFLLSQMQQARQTPARSPAVGSRR
jgi:pimeloyl-ACP methyl ester carboxylesterase